jgi:hypothetical protein
MTTIDADRRFEAGREFIRREGRVLERRLFAAIFEDAPADGVVDALRAYRNADGGFGHGLEPDKLCPDSLAIDVEVALASMAAVVCADRKLIERACDFLTTISIDGAVPLASPVIEQYPRAVHWADWTYRPDVNPTAGLAGLLYRLDIDHPWRDEATAWCWSSLEAGLPSDAHAVGEALVFLEHVEDAERAARIAQWISPHLPRVSYLRLDPHDPSYGVTPLHYAPEPGSRWRALFPDATIAGHLDRLEADQQEDGGWAITWEPPSRAATLAYRAMETLRALRVLTAYGRTVCRR